MTIGEKIKELRKAKGLTQTQLANKIDTTTSSVCLWGKGIVEPHLFSCIMLADVFNVSLDELCCRDFKGGK